MLSLRVDFDLPYKSQNIRLISKIIKGVSKILNDYFIIKIILTFFYSLLREIQIYLWVKEIGS